MKLLALIAALTPVALVSAAQFIVAVGENNGLTFDPTSVNASVGDTIAFQFKAKNHTVTQSTFANPCSQMTTPNLGIDSGFMAVAANATQIPQWSFTLNNASAPLWFFCRQTGHCQKGMVFAINPTAAKSFAAYQAAAMSSTGTTSSTPGSAASPSASVTGGTTTTSNSASSRLSLSATSVLTVIGLVAGLAL